METAYKMVRADGATSVILNKGRILMLKRVNIPFILNPGMWYFLSGGRKKGETYLQTAHREVEEEIKLDKKDLKLLYRGTTIFADNKRRVKWRNSLFIFASRTDKVEINYEHTAFKWTSFSGLLKERKTLQCICDQKKFLSQVKRCIKMPDARPSGP